MKLTLSKMLGIAALAIAGIGASLITATPAQATTTITCSAYGTNYNKYPTDSVGHAQRCSTNINGTITTPTTARANILFAAVSTGFGSQAKVIPLAVRNQLAAVNVKYFFFTDRAAADIYFAGQAPYNTFVTGPESHTFRGAAVPPATGGTRCGNTGFGWSGITLYIAVAVYDNCSYDNFLDPKITSLVNPALEKTILHESGHAFDFSFSTIAGRANIPSQRAGFIELWLKDGDNLTPTSWASMGPTARNKHVCTLFFPTYKPSQLEQDLGAIKGKGTVADPYHGNSLGQVCSIGSPYGTRYPFWVAQGNPPNANMDYTPTQIALDRLKYFMSDRQETFAELFVTEIFDTEGTPNFLQFTDKAMHNDAIVDPSISMKRSFNCTRNIVSSYINTLQPPSGNTPDCVTTKPL